MVTSDVTNCIIPHTSAATQPDAGIVKIQAQTIFFATPQRTAEKPFNEPTPTIAPVTVWVVETGMPNTVARARVKALAVSEQNPLTGLNFVIFIPMVLTMRQPPKQVPRAITKLHEMTTQNGIWNLSPDKLDEYSRMAMIPMVFCASLLPCPKLIKADDKN